MENFIQKIKEQNISITGVIHIGAHLAEEEKYYLNLGVEKKNIIWVEANPHLCRCLKEFDPERTVVNAIITDKQGADTTFRLTSFLQSSSIFELGDPHKEAYKWVHETESFTAKSSTIDFFLYLILEKKVNMISMDIQGAELLALKGAENTLKYIDIILTEINIEEMYKGCALVGEIDEFLEKRGFKRIETILQGGWGDALYVRK